MLNCAVCNMLLTYGAAVILRKCLVMQKILGL